MRDTRASKEMRRRSASPSHTSHLVNDSGFITEVEHKVTSVNGQQGDVELTIPDPQVPSDWGSSTGPSRILNKPTLKRMETYAGTTNSSGVYSVVYSPAYTVTPEVHPQIISGTPSQVITLTTSTRNGFTVTVTERTAVSVLGISVVSSTANPVNAASVSILVLER